MVALPDSTPLDTGELILPLFVDPRYNYSIDLEDDVFQFTIHWNENDSAWYLDLLGISNDVNIKGIKLVTGVNLIKPYAILELGGLYVIDNDGEGLDPDYDNIGTRYQLYYVPKSLPGLII